MVVWPYPLMRARGRISTLGPYDDLTVSQHFGDVLCLAPKDSRRGEGYLILPLDEQRATVCTKATTCAYEYPQANKGAVSAPSRCVGPGVMSPNRTSEI